MVQRVEGVGLGLGLDEPVGPVAPDLAHALALVPAAGRIGAGRAGVLGDHGGGVRHGAADGVVEVAADMAPVIDGEFPAPVAHVGVVGLRGGGAENVRIVLARAKHVAGVALEQVEGAGEGVTEEAEVQTDVLVQDLLPGGARIYDAGRLGVGVAAVGIDVAAQVGAHGHRGGEGVGGGAGLVAEQTVGGAELQVGKPAGSILQERLFVDVPTGGHGGEEAPAMVGGEAGGTVIAAVELQQVAAGIVVVETAEVAAGGPAVAGVRDGLVAVAHGYAGRGRGVQAGDGVLDVGVVVILFLITGQQGEVVVLAEGERVVGVEVDALVVGVGVGAGVLAVLGDAQLGAAALDGGHAVHHIDVRGDGHGLVVGDAQAVGVIQVDEPVLQGLELQAGRDVQAVPQGLGVGAALQVGNHGVFHIVAVVVDVVLGGELAGHGVVEAVADGAVAEGAVGLAVDELGAEGELEPVGHLGLRVGIDVEALVTHVGEAEGAVFVIHAATHVVLHLFAAAADGQVVVVLERPVLVVELEIVGVAETLLRVLEGGRVGGGVVADFGPRVHGGVTVDEPLQVGDLLVGVLAGRVGVGGAVVPEMGEIDGIRHLREAGGGVPTGVAGVADDGLAVGAALGRHEDDAVGGAGAVDRGGGGVLQHGNALDVIGVHVLQAHFHTVHQDVGRPGAAEVAAAAEGDGGLGARGAGRRVGNGQAGNHALEGLGGVHHGTLGEVVTLDLGDGAGQVDLLLDAVTDDDRLFQHLGVILQDHVQGSAVPGKFLGDIADAGENEDVAGLDAAEGVGAVDVGNCSVLRAFHENGPADDRFAGGIGDRSPDRLGSLCQHDEGSQGGGDGRQDGFAKCFAHKDVWLERVSGCLCRKDGLFLF